MENLENGEQSLMENFIFCAVLREKEWTWAS